MNNFAHLSAYMFRFYCNKANQYDRNKLQPGPEYDCQKDIATFFLRLASLSETLRCLYSKQLKKQKLNHMNTTISRQTWRHSKNTPNEHTSSSPGQPHGKHDGWLLLRFGSGQTWRHSKNTPNKHTSSPGQPHGKHGYCWGLEVLVGKRGTATKQIHKWKLNHVNTISRKHGIIPQTDQPSKQTSSPGQSHDKHGYCWGLEALVGKWDAAKQAFKWIKA